MASNNTDYAYGEVRDTQGIATLTVQIKDSTATTAAPIKAGDCVVISDASNGGSLTVKKLAAANASNVMGVVMGAKDEEFVNEEYVEILLRGITRIRQTASAAIALGAFAGIKDAKFLGGAQTNTGKAFAFNIGGVLADGDTGLWYIDCIAGKIGGYKP